MERKSGGLLAAVIALGCGGCGGSDTSSNAPDGVLDAGGALDVVAADGAPTDVATGFDSAAQDSASLADGGAVVDATDTGTVMSGEAGSGYGGDGPVAFATSAVSVTSGSDSFTLHLWVPVTSGPHPVVSFSPGLMQLSAGYTPYATRLASWGFVVLMRDDPGILVSGDTVAADLAYTVETWLPVQNTTTGSVLVGKVDLAHVGLAGHSRGGQATLVAAEQGLLGKVRAWVGLDPVNTAYSAGTGPAASLGSIGIPTLYLGAGVETNCAPTGDNYQTLYAASPSPSIAITVVGAAHPQFEDLGNCSSCILPCSPMGTASSQAVLALSIRYLTAFMARELLGDASVGAQLQGAGAPADEASGVITLVSK